MASSVPRSRRRPEEELVLSCRLPTPSRMIELTSEIAEKVAKAALSKAKELRTPMTVSVVDEGARLVLCIRGDGAGPFTPETSKAKAVAAVAFRRSTKTMVEQHKVNPLFWSSVPTILSGQVLPTAGGAPIMKDGKIIGGVGCGGGTGEQDQECADAGSAAIS